MIKMDQKETLFSGGERFMMGNKHKQVRQETLWNRCVRSSVEH